MYGRSIKGEMFQVSSTVKAVVAKVVWLMKTSKFDHLDLTGMFESLVYLDLHHSFILVYLWLTAVNTRFVFFSWKA